MTSETETVADVLAELRFEAREGRGTDGADVLDWGNRIAAAHAREAKDAARYRWVRGIAGESDMWNIELREPDGDDSYIGTYLFDDSLDAAIDAAMPRVEVEG